MFPAYEHKYTIGFQRNSGLKAMDFLKRSRGGSRNSVIRILTDHPEVDVVQLQINYLDWNDAVAQSGRCYEVATRHGKEVIVMEPVKGGLLASLPEAAMRLFLEFHGGTGSPRLPDGTRYGGT